MSFDFQITADPAQAARAIDQIERRLAGLEASARDTSGRFLAMGPAAQKAGGAVGNAFDFAAQRARAAARATGNAFGGLTEVFRREKEMLERIHGPMLQLQQDVQALEMLHRKGMITAAQYNAELRKSKTAAGIGSARAAGGGGNALMATAGKLGLALGAAQVASEVVQLGNAYQNLQNRLRTVATDQANLAELMDRTRQIANASRQEWSATVEGFTRMFHATKELGLSQEEVLTLTDRLNKAIVLSGASSAEANAGLVQLSQGLASGVLRGDELRSVLEQLPAVADVIAKGMGVTRGQLRALGAEGKITTKIILDAFNKAGAELDANFGKTVPTLSQQWTVFKNEITNTVGGLLESSHAVEIFGGVLKIALSILEPFAKILGTVFDGISAVIGGISDFADALGIDLAQVAKYIFSPLSALTDLASGVASLASEFFDLGEVVPVTETVSNALQEAAKGGSAAFSQWVRESDEFQRLRADAAKKGVEHLESFLAEANRLGYELQVQEARAADITRQYQVFAHYMATGVIPSYAKFTDIISIATTKHKMLTDEIEAGNRRVARSIGAVVTEANKMLRLFASDRGTADVRRSARESTPRFVSSAGTRRRRTGWRKRAAPPRRIGGPAGATSTRTRWI